MAVASTTSPPKVADWVAQNGLRDGLVTLHLRHTSASLLIQENADPDVRRDLESFFARLVPDGDPLFSHTVEGDDDMPAHVRTALTAVNLSIPVSQGQLALGTWQGIYLWEHRRSPHSPRRDGAFCRRVSCSGSGSGTRLQARQSRALCFPTPLLIGIFRHD